MANLLETLPKAAAKIGPWSWMLVAGTAILAGLMAAPFLAGDSATEKHAFKTEGKSKGPGQYVAPPLPPMPSPQAILGRLATGTVVVLGLAVVSLCGARRWLKLNVAPGMSSGNLKLIETLQLGNRCALHLVHLGKREVLVGTDGGG